MNARTRRKIEMATGALEFSRAHPDPSPGYTAALATLEERVTRAEQLAAQQREGIIEARAATARKRDLRQTLKQAHLVHLARVAAVAAREVPELPQKFVLTRATNAYLAFRTAARGMQAEALGRKEVLVKHGLAESVLESLAQALDQFDAAVEQGSEGRRAHVGASAELDAVADEIVQIVKVMDGLNHVRFAADAEQLAAWASASNVIGPFRPATKPAPKELPAPPAGGEVRPAA